MGISQAYTDGGGEGGGAVGTVISHLRFQKKKERVKGEWKERKEICKF